MAEQDSSPSHAPRTGRNKGHASSACEGCRTRKIKCDETRPACNRCIKRGSTCTWTVEKDRRTARGRTCQDCVPLRVELARVYEELAALKAQISNGTAAQAAETPACSVTESPPTTPAALLDAWSVESLFALPSLTNVTNANSYFQEPTFAPQSQHLYLNEDALGHAELERHPRESEVQSLPHAMAWDDASLRVVFGDDFGCQLQGTWPAES